MNTDYNSFLKSKSIVAEPRGLTSTPTLASHLFPFQRHCVEFGLQAGSFGLFLDTGLGKTACELEWALHAAAASNGRALILTPLAVARQIEAEGKRWNYNCRVIREQSEAQDGINICNYDRLEHLTPSEFGAVVLDESSILKNFTGKTTRSLIDAFRGHRWRMAATATPAPNDHTELGNHSEFLGILPMNDMLVRWFIHDSANTAEWRLKGYASESFWNWMVSWCRMAEHPKYLGDSIDGYTLPPMNIVRHQAEMSDLIKDPTSLFGAVDVSATKIHEVKRQTADSRARACLKAIEATSDPFVVWCDTDYEADSIFKTLKPAFGSKLAEVRGSMLIDAKETALERFRNGDALGLITKPSICGFGLNWQFAHTMVFAGRSFSYESWYQAVRRMWRFGQKQPVTVHLIVAEGEDSIGRVIDRKADGHDDMKRQMSEAMLRAVGKQSKQRIEYNPTHKGRLPQWLSA